MKNTLRNLFFVSISACSLFAFTACEKDNDDDQDMSKTFTLSGSASGDQEVPVVSTTASGNLTGSYDSLNNRLIYNITWNGLSGEASMAHFHGPALAGENADVLLPLEMIEVTATGRAADTIQVSDAFETALLEGKVYYNIHTLANPAGEIRGQISPTEN